jgi:UDP-galactopyranose mutase
MKFCIVGAGFSGAVIGRALVEAGHQATIVDERPHIGGNCYCETDAETGVLVHVYGPHIFHTGDERVWTYVQKFAEMVPYHHRVKAIARGAVYTLPINLATINQFFGTTMGPGEARAFIAGKALCIEEPRNFEEQALSTIGDDLYRTFFRGYTLKQWGLNPAQLPASVLKRLPLRFDYNDGYFTHPHQAMPRAGYTAMIAAILSAPGIEVRLAQRFEDVPEIFDHVIYSGPIDRYFDYRLGRLGYRTLDFETFRAKGDFQGTAVMNYCDEDTRFTRITEHKHFAPWSKTQFADTICYREFSRAMRADDIPYYPIRQVDEEAMLKTYVALARQTPGVTFVGRLGTYRYLDMDVTIGEALKAADQIVELARERAPLPTFFIEP